MKGDNKKQEKAQQRKVKTRVYSREEDDGKN